jgi:hypothetical protein
MRDNDVNLDDLSRLLKSRSLPSQSEIAKEINTDQGFITHAKRGDLRRVTPRVRRLYSYVSMRLVKEPVPASVARGVKAYLSGGGDPALLLQQIEILSAAHGATRRDAGERKLKSAARRGTDQKGR